MYIISKVMIYAYIYLATYEQLQPITFKKVVKDLCRLISDLDSKYLGIKCIEYCNLRGLTFLCKDQYSLIKQSLMKQTL